MGNQTSDFTLYGDNYMKFKGQKFIHLWLTVHVSAASNILLHIISFVQLLMHILLVFISLFFFSCLWYFTVFICACILLFFATTSW